MTAATSMPNRAVDYGEPSQRAARLAEQAMRSQLPLEAHRPGAALWPRPWNGPFEQAARDAQYAMRNQPALS